MDAKGRAQLTKALNLAKFLLTDPDNRGETDEIRVEIAQGVVDVARYSHRVKTTVAGKAGITDPSDETLQLTSNLLDWYGEIRGA